MVIAVDFDGTIVEDKYPEIGKEILFSITTLKKLQKERNLLILWSVREGELLDEAVEFCHQRGLDFYAVNRNHPEEDSVKPRKLKADMFIDDRQVGGLPDWGVIYEMVHNKWSYDRYLQEVNKEGAQKSSFFGRLFGR